MGFSPDLKTFYHTDCGPRTIYKYEYDPTDHTLSNRSIFVQLGTDMGVPDGMTVDSEGNVWGAVWGSSCVIKYDPDGNELERISFPCHADLFRHVRRPGPERPLRDDGQVRGR